MSSSDRGGGVEDARDDEEHAVRHAGAGPAVGGDGAARPGGLQQQRPPAARTDAATHRL